jgi:outer membrane lipoprotein-sorting protein
MKQKTQENKYMKLKPRCLLIVYALLLMQASITAQDLDINQIVQRYFEAIGWNNIDKVETVVATGTSIQYGQETSFRQIQKRPDKAYMEVLLADGQIIRQGYNGNSGWMLASWMNTAEPVELLGPDLKTIKDMGNIEGDLWNWKEKGHKLILVGIQDLAGKKAYRLKLTKADGDIDEMYIDTESFILKKMIRKTSIDGSEVEVEIYYDDYRNLEGIVLPFRIEQRLNNQQGMVINFKEIKLNIEVDNKIFEKPQ